MPDGSVPASTTPVTPDRPLPQPGSLVAAWQARLGLENAAPTEAHRLRVLVTLICFREEFRIYHRSVARVRTWMDGPWRG
jgi:hypothetical protein